MTQTLSNQNITKSFFKYVSLNVISMLSLSFYILVDTYFIASSVGYQGLTALNIVLPIFTAMNGFGYLIGIGSSTLFSIFKGENNSTKANQIFTHGAIFALVVSLVFSIIGIFFSDNISSLSGADDTILPIASSYISILLAISPAFIFNTFLSNFVRNDNSPKLATIAIFVSSFSNIILDYVFVVIFDMDMIGAAIATAVSPVISIAILSIHFIKKKNTFKFVKCPFNFKYISKLTSIGFPSYITEVSNGIVIFILNYIILSYSGNIGVAAYGVISNIALVAIYIFNGVALGTQPIISYNYGARNFKNIAKTLKLALITSLGIGVIIYLSGLFFASPIVSIFNSEKDATLQSIAENGVYIYFIAFIFAGLNIVFISYFSSTVKPIKSFILSISRGFVFVIIFAFMLPNFFNLNGVWISIPLAEITTLIIAISLILFDKKRKADIISNVNKRI